MWTCIPTIQDVNVTTYMGLFFEYIQNSNTTKHPDHEELWLMRTWHTIELEDGFLLLVSKWNEEPR